MKEYKVYEFAKIKNIPANKLLEILKNNGFNVSNVMSKITQEETYKIESLLSNDSLKSKNEQATINSNSEITSSEQHAKETKKENNFKKNKNNKELEQEKINKELKDEDKALEKLKVNNKKEEVKMNTFLKYSEDMTINDISKKLNLDSSEILKKLFLLGIVANINQSLDKDTMDILADEFGFEIEHKITVDKTDLSNLDFEDNEKDLKKRPPIITIMGHIDHGKTSLLDKIRNSAITKTEAGGITQHIGAYQIEKDNNKITFLDTPGHEAFTLMRARGALITDIAILVVSAEDSVMPQTIESIDHAKAAKIPIIVAINKIDKEGANPEKVRKDLMNHNLLDEKYGGDTIFVEVSALTGQGIDKLLEMILLQSEMLELKANPNRTGFGTIIESRLDKGKGVVASLLIQKGQVNIGDSIVTGNGYGKIRTMIDDQGKNIKNAGISMPVEITGLNVVPNAGDIFSIVKDEKEARKIGEMIIQKNKNNNRTNQTVSSSEALLNKITVNQNNEINILIKSDVKGSSEALKVSLEKINKETQDANINIIRTGVGAISDSDVNLAIASNAIIIAFNTRIDSNAKNTAKSSNVKIISDSIIYNILENIEDMIKGFAKPEFSEELIGEAEIREIFKFNKINIAGCYLRDGKVKNDSKVKIIRDDKIIYESELESLKREKNDVKEVAKGMEFGCIIKNYNDIKVDDILEFYEEVKVNNDE